MNVMSFDCDIKEGITFGILARDERRKLGSKPWKFSFEFSGFKIGGGLTFDEYDARSETVGGLDIVLLVAGRSIDKISFVCDCSQNIASRLTVIRRVVP